jgi:pyruvate dehydrogenase E1 component beta subunit
MFTHVPGLKVVMPCTPYDAKGLLVAAVYDGNPVMYIDDRWLYGETGQVPEELYSVPIGKAVVRREGKDVTVVAISWMAHEALRAAGLLETDGIDAEVIDLRSLKPLDEVMIIESVKKTGKLVIADGGWKTCGIAAEIAALASTHAFDYLKAPILRVTLPDCPAPISSILEDSYYPKAADMVMAVKQVIGATVGR